MNVDDDDNDDDSIIFIDSRNNKHGISIDSELDITITHHSTANNSIMDDNIKNESPINTENYKDILLSSLYSQVEFLRSQLEEKDLLIRTLIIKESDVLNHH